MYLIGVLLLIIGSVNVLLATHLRCYEDDGGGDQTPGNRSVQLHERCRACVLFIDFVNISSTVSTINSVGKLLNRHHELSIEELISYQEAKPNYRRRRRHLSTPLRQSCARSANGPLYGYNQTHCYCDSDRCNTNLQRCIYEVIGKSLFSCYHSSTPSERPLKIHQKCRACRLRRQLDSTYYYECLTFAEEEHSNQTHCTCQHPLCNRDATICERSLLPTLPSTRAQLTTTSTQSSQSTSKGLETTSFSAVHNDTNADILIDVPFTDEPLLIESTTVVLEDTSSTRTEAMESRNHGQTFLPHAVLLTINCLLSFHVWSSLNIEARATVRNIFRWRNDQLRTLSLLPDNECRQTLVFWENNTACFPKTSGTELPPALSWSWQMFVHLQVMSLDSVRFLFRREIFVVSWWFSTDNRKKRAASMVATSDVSCNINGQVQLRSKSAWLNLRN